MSNLEALLGVAGEAPLSEMLNYELPSVNTSVIDRRQHVRAYPTSASTLTPSGVRTVRIRLGGDTFVHTSSVRLMFTVTNKGTQPLTPTMGPYGTWGQCYVRSAGTEICNVPAYNRHHELHYWKFLTNLEQFGEAGINGFAGSLTGATGTAQTNLPNYGTIAAGASYTVMHRLAMPPFDQRLALPIRYAPIELEMSLTPSASDWLVVTANDSSTSSSWEIGNIQLLYDSLELDPEVLTSYYNQLLSNRTLSIPYFSVWQTVQPIPAGATSLSFSSVRAFSKLAYIFLTFRNTTTGAKGSSFACPKTQPTDQLTAIPNLVDVPGPVVRMYIGPHAWPDSQPNASTVEQFYQLQKVLGKVPNIDRQDFLQSTYVLAFNLERMPGDAASSISTRSGDLVRIDINNITADACQECWATYFGYSVLAVRESGCSVLT
jgi:hypothetical protein